ncbi:MAG: M20/M25/M40 family metallo-hydrolase [Acidobacteriota bacterium]
MKSTLNFLASGHLRGRATGTPESEVTVAYLASVFERNGLSPVANSETGFLQTFPLVHSLPLESSRCAIENEEGNWEPLQFGTDYLPAPWGAEAEEITEEVVVAGYGLNAPEQHYSDYDGLRVEGKLVAFFSKVPVARDDRFKQFSKEDLEDPFSKVLEAQRRGALAALIILADGEEMPYKDASSIDKSKLYLKDEVDAIRIPTLFLTARAAEKLVRPSGAPEQRKLADIKKRLDETLQPVDLVRGRRLLLETHYQRRANRGHNVVGLLPGSDVRLRDQYILIGAHHDHIGVSDQEVIFYGADDDASGTAALLELSYAFSTNPVRPKRSVVFAAWGAEEIGLFGSKYYVHHPLVPLDKTVAMIQMDMVGRNEDRGSDPSNKYPPEKPESNGNSVNAIGGPFSQGLKSLLQLKNERIGLDIRFRYDFDYENLIKRSDHWPFLKERVPAILLFTGFHPDYHKSTDTADKINYPKLQKITRLVYLVAWDLADQRETPEFHEQPSKTMF